jgi:hypothetical protein
MTSSHALSILLALAGLSFACGDDDTVAADSGTDATASDSGVDPITGVYNVETVTCGGEAVPIMVTATVTFDGASYLEEWTLPESDCQVTFRGTLESMDAQITLRDVEVTCAAACDAIGFCDPTHCTADQTYQYTRTGDELLLSFTQAGDEFSCGPCGDGVASTYLLVAIP